LPADWFGIRNRGRVEEGYFADLLIMRPEEFKTEAVFRKPEVHPEGLDMVIINGKVVLDDGDFKADALNGRMLRK
jgi:N-acyl-D-aspartate/D-glutamate deacylase